MRHVLLTIALAAASIAAQAQTLNVVQGNVTYAFAANGDDMTYTDSGQTLTIQGKSFNVSDITKIAVDETVVSNNTVGISYNGTSAAVVIAGNVAPYVKASVSGAHVSIEQTNTSDIDGDEITYSLSGTSTDGSLTLGGSYKCTIQLAGITLTNPSGAAISISNKKRIQISAKKETVNTLTDGASGSQTGCLYSKGQIQLQGGGSLTVYGNTKHGIKSGDYITIKNLTLNILSAVGDGINCNGYFQMKSGNVTISGTGDDGIQCDIDGTTYTATDDHEDEDTGNIYIDGGTLSITTTAAGAKGLKADSIAYVNDGTLTINASGSVDTSDSSDPSYVAGIGAGKFVQNGGTISMTIKGSAGRGVKAYDIETNGGTLTINNSATPATISSDVKGAKGLKALNMALTAGTISITMSGNASKAIRCGDGTQSTSSGGGGGWRAPGGGSGGGGGFNPGGGGGGMGGGSSWTNITGSYTQGKSDGSGPTLTVTQTGSASSSSSAKAIKAICAIIIYGGETTVSTSTSGAEGLESKTSVDIRGGKHYLKCYDDCINSAGKITFNGGATVCYSTGNDAIDSNAGTTGAITIGDGAVLAYQTKGDPDEAFDCDNNNYIQITGTGIAIGAGGKQSSATGTITGAAQGYSFPGSVSFKANVYNTLADASGKNLVTFQLPAAISSTCTFITATGMKSGSSYTIKSSTSAPTDATTAWHGLYLGSSATGTTSVTSFTAK
ncbi:MAG: carbohydrate-binding domain-containing protein [Prevotella sp.]|nr:carbohydrate-binding domain-containing protein [Prevotella sp.]